jgi:hypothetical protein
MATALVTHHAVFGLYTSINNPQDRIYSGSVSGTIVLTVEMTTVPATGQLEVIVDSHSITDGVMTQGGSESRTFTIEKARTIDLILHRQSQVATGSYTISLLL